MDTVSPEGYAEALDHPALMEPRGAFVTLRREGELRGCIGFIEGVEPLARAVALNAASAATRDYRFPPVRPEEVPHLTIEISALSPLSPMRSPADIEVGTHGLLVSRSGRRGVLLPQVAVEHRMDVETFLCETCRKAMLPRDAWKQGASVHLFSAEVFSEKDQEA